MQYYIFRIQNGFESSIDQPLLSMLMEHEHDAFYQQQMQYILGDIPWKRVLELARYYFHNRDDIDINDFSIAWRSLKSHKIDELIALPTCLRLEIESEESPLRTFLEEFQNDFIFMPRNEISKWEE